MGWGKIVALHVSKINGECCLSSLPSSLSVYKEFKLRGISYEQFPIIVYPLVVPFCVVPGVTCKCPSPTANDPTRNTSLRSVWYSTTLITDFLRAGHD